MVKGTFCEVELRGKLRKQQLIIPRSSYNDGFVYLVDEDSRLVKRKVEVEFSQSNLICLVGGITPGETLIVSDPTPAIEGMLVTPLADESATDILVAEASGERSLR